MGYAAALSILQLIAVAILAKLLIRLTRRASAAMAKE